MRYLIEYKKEFIITVGVFVTFVLVLLWAIFALVRGTFSYEHLIALCGLIFEIAGWWHNMPTSEANAKATAFMRYEKAELKYGEMEEYDDDIYDDEEDYEEDEDDEEEVEDDETDSK